MIKHVVMWKFKSFAQGRSKAENIALVHTMLSGLLEKPEFEIIKSFEFHKNVNPKDGMFDAVLEMTFESLKDVQTYRDLPAHKSVSTFVSLVREERASVDYEI